MNEGNKKHFLPLSVSISTWNVNATPPEKLYDLQKLLDACSGSDLVVFGIQEMIDLTPTNNMAMENDSKRAQSWIKTVGNGISSNKEGIKYILIQQI